MTNLTVTKPYAKFAFDWPEMGGRFFNVVDPEGLVYADGSTIAEKTVLGLGLEIVF